VIELGSTDELPEPLEDELEALPVLTVEAGGLWML